MCSYEYLFTYTNTSVCATADYNVQRPYSYRVNDGKSDTHQILKTIKFLFGNMRLRLK